MAATPAQFQAAADKIVQLAPLEQQFVHGSDTTDVPTENGPVPAMAKIERQARERVTAVLQDVGDAATAAGRAEDAALAAEALGNRWPTVDAGIANTADGRYFSTPSDVDGQSAIIYRRTGATAVEETRIANLTALSALAPSVAAGSVPGLLDDASDVAVGIVDLDGRRTWLEANWTGKPTPHAAELIAESSNAQPSELEDLLILFDPLSRRYVRVIDKDGNVVAPVTGGASQAFEMAAGWLFVTDLTTGVRKLITQAGNPRNPRFVGEFIYWDSDTGVMSARHDGTDVRSAWSNTMLITGWGDSLTEGGSPGGSYLGFLADILPGVTVSNQGQSSQMSGGVAARQGGIELFVTVTGGSIPATTAPVAVTITMSSARHKLNGSFVGTLGGVAGTMYPGDTTYLFARATAGAAVAVPPDTKFQPAEAANHRSDLSIFWTGRNDVAFGWPYEVTGPAEATVLMVKHLSARLSRFLVLSVTTSTGETVGTPGHTTIVAQNALLAETFPDNYVDVRRFLIDQGLASVGITPTSQDLADIAGDTIPTSLLYDGLHVNIPGKQAVAIFLKQQLIKRGWAQ